MNQAVPEKIPGGTVAYLTSHGERHKNNQDAIFIAGGFVVVIDGMGHYRDTPEAVKIFLDHLRGNFEENSLSVGIESVARGALAQMQTLIPRDSDADREDRHSGGLAFACVSLPHRLPGKVEVSRLGDVHVIIANQTSEDDTAWETEDQVFDENTLEHCLAPWREESLTKMDLQNPAVETDDFVLICSDGLTKVIPSDDIIKIVQTLISQNMSVAQIVDYLHAEAVSRYKNWGRTRDDITIVLYIPDPEATF